MKNIKKFAILLMLFCIVFVPSCNKIKNPNRLNNEFSSDVTDSGMTEDGFRYDIYRDEYAVICNYKGQAQNLVIPSTIKGIPVTIIGNGAFRNCNSFTSAVVPDSVTVIDMGAFSGCGMLTYITLGKGVADIGGDAVFSDCNNLVSIAVDSDNHTYSSENGVLYNKDKTELISCPSGFNGAFEVPDGVKSIKEQAFSNCIYITDVIISDSVTSIEFGAFERCVLLTSINIPNSVTSIGESAFFICDSLESITVDPDNPTYSSEDGVLYNKDKTELLACPAGKEGSFTVPNTVTSIGERAFFVCDSLKSIVIPDSVTSIEYGAFNGCSGLTSINIPDNVTEIEGLAFDGCSSLTSINIPDNVTVIGNFAFSDCSSLTSVTIGNSVTSIGDWAFSSCSNITSINIPDSVTSIGENAFWCCEALIKIENGILYVDKWVVGYDETVKNEYPTSIVLHQNTVGIAGNAFNNADFVESVSIPNSVKNICDTAFAGCYYLESINIPNSVTNIGEDVFLNCSNLTEIKVDANNPSYSSQNGVLYNKDKTKLIACPAALSGSFEIPSSVVTIGDYAFYGCEYLTSIKIPNSVKIIDDFAFYGCTNLTTITIPDSVTDIGACAFEGCKKIKKITIPSSVKNIGECAFRYCDNLKSITVDKNNNSYSSKDGVLYNKNKTELIQCPAAVKGSFTVPSSVTSICKYAFTGCKKINKIIIPKSVTNIGEWAFEGCDSLTIYAEASSWQEGWNSNWNPSVCPVKWGYKG